MGFLLGHSFLSVILCIIVVFAMFNDAYNDDSFSNSEEQWKDYMKKNQEVNSNLMHKEQKRGKGEDRWDQKYGPPPINEYALMARYIVNQADWSPVATISSQDKLKTYPFVNVISISDGVKYNGSGIPYLFLTPLDFTAKDLMKDTRSTLLMTLAQGDYCKSQNYDPMDPRCARVMLSGKIKALKNNTAEHTFAKEAMFGRHPWLANMPEDHHFYFAKLKIYQIALLDTFGGPKYINIQDYLHPPTNNVTSDFFRWFKSKYSRDLVKTENLFKNKEMVNNFLPSVYRT